MKKTMTLNEMEILYGDLSRDWNERVKSLHLANKQLYNLISLKKNLETKHALLQDTIFSIMRAHGATETAQGGLKVPDDKIDEVNEEFTDLSEQTAELEYEPILIRENDSIPSALMEALFDFVIIE